MANSYPKNNVTAYRRNELESNAFQEDGLPQTATTAQPNITNP